MTKEEMAALLHGREYNRHTITPEHEAQAKANGLLIVMGESDDLIEFYGAFREEVGAYNGTTALFDAKGPLGDWESLDHDDEEAVTAHIARKPHAKMVEGKWDWKGYSWWIETALPHATLDIMEEGETYCRGIVLAVADLEAPATPTPTL